MRLAWDWPSAIEEGAGTSIEDEGWPLNWKQEPGPAQLEDTLVPSIWPWLPSRHIRKGRQNLKGLLSRHIQKNEIFHCRDKDFEYL